MRTPDEVAEILHCSRRKVFDLIGSGELRSIKIGALRRITDDDLRRFVDGLKAEAAS
jgi:excisionase family DNA binding protein